MIRKKAKLDKHEIKRAYIKPGDKSPNNFLFPCDYKDSGLDERELSDDERT